MVKYLEVKDVISIPVEQICNKCGKVIVDESDYVGNYFSTRFSFGYGSDFDLETHQIDLCDECFDELIKTFKINSKVEE